MRGSRAYVGAPLTFQISRNVWFGVGRTSEGVKATFHLPLPHRPRARRKQVRRWQDSLRPGQITVSRWGNGVLHIVAHPDEARVVVERGWAMVNGVRYHALFEDGQSNVLRLTPVLSVCEFCGEDMTVGPGHTPDCQGHPLPA